MKLPRDVSGTELAKALKNLGYAVMRQEGSHIRLSTEENGQHHLTVPNHSPIKVGTLSGIFKAIAAHHKISVEQVMRALDL